MWVQSLQPSYRVNTAHRAGLGEDEGETTTLRSKNHDRPHLNLERCVFMTHCGERQHSVQ